MLYHLIYVSTASRAMDDQDLLEILRVSRQNNARSRLSGMLLYKDGTFMQALEGEQDVLKHRYNIITADSRHKDLMLLSEKPIEQRSFADWSMGFHNLKALDDEALEGFSPFLKESFTSHHFGDNPDMAHRLLLAFRDYG